MKTKNVKKVIEVVNDQAAIRNDNMKPAPTPLSEYEHEESYQTDYKLFGLISMWSVTSYRMNTDRTIK